MSRPLKLLQWNVNGARTRRAALLAILQGEHVDVAVLQESRLTETAPFSIPGYTLFRTPAIEGGERGLITAVKADIPAHPIANPFFCGDEVETLAVSIRLLDRNLLVYNIYRRHTGILSLGELFTAAEESDIFISGDFNAHHPVLHSTSPPPTTLGIT